MVKKGFIDHTTYETTSILTFIEKKYNLEPLSSRDRDAPNLTGFFEYGTRLFPIAENLIPDWQSGDVHAP